MYRQRLLTRRLRELATAFPVVVISGARQVGKSTLLQHLYGDKAGIVVFDPVVDVGNARQDPELFLANNRPPLVLDEVQYAPELIASLKREVDKDRSPGQYILSGSQQWSVLTSVSESLAGRAAFLDLEGFSLAEAAGSEGSWLSSWIADPAKFLASPPSRLQHTRTLYESLWRGGLPDATLIEAAFVPDFHAAYQRTCIERDVRLLADVADWQLFGRFIRLCAALSAQEINRRQLGRELGVTPQTADRWLGLLKATYQWFEVPAYSGNAVKRVSGKPKGYLADTGMTCHAQLLSSPEALGGHPMLGALFETAVVAEIRKQAERHAHSSPDVPLADEAEERKSTSFSNGTADSIPLKSSSEASLPAATRRESPPSGKPTLDCASNPASSSRRQGKYCRYPSRTGPFPGISAVVEGAYPNSDRLTGNLSCSLDLDHPRSRYSYSAARPEEISPRLHACGMDKRRMDSTTVKLRPSRLGRFPGTSKGDDWVLVTSGMIQGLYLETCDRPVRGKPLAGSVGLLGCGIGNGVDSGMGRVKTEGSRTSSTRR